jgi:hypothetical protein
MGWNMSKYVRYSEPYESRAQARVRWRDVHMKIYVTKWLLFAVACLILLTAFAAWGWRVHMPIWGYPVLILIFLWLYFCGGLAWSRITGWRAYVSTVMYMEALEDGLCKDMSFTWEGRDRWYRENGSPWRLQPVADAMREHTGE